MSKWIDVNDRLPDTGDTVIIRIQTQLFEKTGQELFTKTEICAGQYIFSEWCVCEQDFITSFKWYAESGILSLISKITHWMPIPELDESELETTPETKYIIVHVLPEGQELTIDVKKICTICPASEHSQSGAGCIIEFVTGRMVYMRESYEEVQKMIGAYKND